MRLYTVIRKGIEESNEGLLFSYYCGASGNINLTVKFPERDICGADYVKVGQKLSEVVLSELDTAKKIIRVDNILMFF